MTDLELNKQGDRLRLHVVKMIGSEKKGHFGGSLSAADIVAALYFKVMNIDPKNLKDVNRDRFILSKGHSCPVQYAALACIGAFPKHELQTFKELGSMLQGHPDRNKTPGIEVNTGSLGQGLSQGNGIALAMKMSNNPAHVYVVVGDGELNEGQVWEAAMFTAAKKLDNLTLIVDKNNLQAMGKTYDRLKNDNLKDKFTAIGFSTVEIDGHDMDKIVEAINKAKNDGLPSCIIANTVKGKGIKEAENNPAFHNGSLDLNQYEKAIADLEALL